MKMGGSRDTLGCRFRYPDTANDGGPSRAKLGPARRTQSCCNVADRGDASTWSRVFATPHDGRAHVDEPSERRRVMEVLHPVVAGMDVHRDTVVVMILRALANARTWKETKTFEAFTDQVRAMVARADEHDVPIVARESTGAYWRPIYRLSTGLT